MQIVSVYRVLVLSGTGWWRIPLPIEIASALTDVEHN